MKYFTKYLPIEGEITEGDNYRDGWGNIAPHKKEGILVHDDKKVKLFLCSRDIQVGDMVKQPHTGDLVQDYKIIGTLELLKKVEAFKVIGEISPDATWVIEGMELSEDDIKFITPFQEYVCLCKQSAEKYDKSCKHYYEMPHGSCSEGCSRIETKTVTLVKGPCGHYH